MNTFLRSSTLRRALALGLCGLLLTMAAPGHSATQIDVQTFSGSKSNQFTRSILPPFGTGVRVGTDNTGVFDLVAPSFSADLFDASLGTLQSVQIVYEGTRVSGNRVDRVSTLCRDSGANTACQNDTLNVSLTIDHGVFTSVGSVDEISTSRTATLRDGQSSTGFNGPVALFAQQTFTDAGNLAAYSGNGTFDLTAFFFPTLQGRYECDPSLATVITACKAEYRAFYGADFDISVIYTYDDGITPPPPPAVPLPAGLPMLIGALSLLAWARHRRS